MSVRHYMAAAAAGPNMAARGPALMGQARAHDRLQSSFHSQTGLGAGSLAGLETAHPAVIEKHGMGYGHYVKPEFRKSASMSLQRPHQALRTGNVIKDGRRFVHPKLNMDKELTKLL